jgi:peptidoglycan L-alanyl-D-glutamate endopeptidase CwlK
MPYTLGNRSLQNLSGVHPDLVAVVKRAVEITEQDFSVIEGIRNINRQRELVKTGKSTTMNSRHLTGHAVDIAPWPISWDCKDYWTTQDLTPLNDAIAG